MIFQQKVGTVGSFFIAAMEEQHLKALQSLRERIRAVCVHDQAQWDSTWKEVFGELSSSRRGLLPPNVFFEVLEANNVILSRSEARLLYYQFHEPNGAVKATKFLRWISLNAPVDHMNPYLLFAQLPQPYRRIQKVLDHDIFDAAWEIITTESARYKSESSVVDGSIISSRSNRDRGERSQNQHKNDFDVAKRRSCEPTQQIPLDHDTQQVVGLASHCILPVVVAAISSNPTDNYTVNPVPILRIVSTANEEGKVLGDFPIAFPVDTQTSEDAASTTNIHVSMKTLSALQLTTNSSCCLAIHLVKTNIEHVEAEPNIDAKPPTPTTRECVNVYTIKVQAASEFLCELVAVISPLQSSPESAIASIVLSPDSQFLAVTSVGSASIAFYSIHREENAEAEHEPVTLTSPTFQVDLEPTRTPFMEDEGEPAVHFLVAPSTSRAKTRSVPSTYAFAVCYGRKVLKYVFPATNSSAPALLTPTKSWEHLTKITASAQDITTQYVVVGCQDGTLVVWDVLRDKDYAFLSPSQDKVERLSSKPLGSSAEISGLIFRQPGYVVALSKPQQRLYFFDVRERGKPLLTRVVSPPPVPSSTSTRQISSHPAVSMTSLALSTATADIPVALVEYSNGMILFYDVRGADAIGSFQTSTLIHTSLMTHPQISSEGWDQTSIVGNGEVLAAVITDSKSAMEAHVNLYSWRDILLVCFPFFPDMLEQRQEELTSSNVKQLFLSNDAVVDPVVPVPPSSITTQGASVDLLEGMFLRLAGELPSSPQQASRTKKATGSTSSPLQSPVGQSSVSLASLPQLDPRQGLDESATNLSAMLEPLVPDNDAFFEQYCRENLDPLVIADKEARLHRKRRELLKVMSIGGAW